MNPLSVDILWSEYRPDRNIPFPSTLWAPNGTPCCTESYELCGVLAREILEVSS